LLRHFVVQSSPVLNQMVGDNYEWTDVFHWLSFDPCACCQLDGHWFVGEEERTKQSRTVDQDQEGQVVVVIAKVRDGRRSPGCICRMLSVDPQGAVSLSNKVAHCLLHAMSPHHNTCRHVLYPAVPCYWKHFKIYYNRPLLD